MTTRTMEQAIEMRGITRTARGINLHFSPIPNWYGCILGFDCPICSNPIDWKWTTKLPGITTGAPSTPPVVTGATLEEYGHRYICVSCGKCGTYLSAENHD